MAEFDDLAEAFDRYARDNAFNAHYDRPATLALAGDVRGEGGGRYLDFRRGGRVADPLLARAADVAVEPLPDESMRDEWPDDWDFLRNNPAFVAFRLLRPANGGA